MATATVLFSVIPFSVAHSKSVCSVDKQEKRAAQAVRETV